MCGVVSICYEKQTQSLGKEAAELLKKLEYRGYDSTGGAFIDSAGGVVLRKKVGAPSLVIERLEIDKLSGRSFIGQVRWATFGSVTDVNAQPHEVNCLAHLIGAHNGNISNTDTLREFLLQYGHQVLSDNDGEMLVHLVEHFYARELRKNGPAPENIRIAALRRAILEAQKMVKGSYAACITAPDITGLFAMKSGSSLYAGKGHDSLGPFIVVSSDLTSVLSKTRFLIPMKEGEGLYFTHDRYEVFSLSTDQVHTPSLIRSRLNIADITLSPRYDFFMEQEIFSATKNIRPLFLYYFAAPDDAVFHPVFEAHNDPCREFLYDFLKLYDLYAPQTLKPQFAKLLQSALFQEIFASLGGQVKENGGFVEFLSEDAALLDELYVMDHQWLAELKVIDRMLIWKKKRTTLKCFHELMARLETCKSEGGRVFVVAAGTSYHAALTGGNFFNNLAQFSIIPANPGAFRSLYLQTLTKRDMLIGVSQSGETKDLVDIYNDVRDQYGDTVLRVAIVNNENSTIPQEKAHFYLPILCGPEIAVAATKSFISQMALFYILAASMTQAEKEVFSGLETIQTFMDLTLKNLDTPVTQSAIRLFLKPSIHLLGTSQIGLAKEGALKIREVVLNHTEGYDAAEFKHGPNTILGKNTIFSLADLEKLHSAMLEFFEAGMKYGLATDCDRYLKYLTMLRNLKLRVEEKMPNDSIEGFKKLNDLYREKISPENYFSNYPLIFICPPDPRDIRITISQIHTHKIRGADIFLIAEENEELRKAVFGKPAGQEHYFAEYIAVPASFDKSVFAFEAALILELLAFKMSVEKMRYLNRMRIENHGVHPDVPKNVSKSITVD